MSSEKISKKRIKILLKRIPSLIDVLKLCNTNKIGYGFFVGTFVYVMTGYRECSDIDILVKDEDMDKLINLFPEGKFYETETEKHLVLGSKQEIEFVSHHSLVREGKVYDIRLNKKSLETRIKYHVGDIDVYLCNPVETIIVKSILQRGKELGKHDIDDVKAIIQSCEIDNEYFQERLEETNSTKIVNKLLSKLNLVI